MNGLTYYINKVLLMTSLFALTTSAVTHAVRAVVEWRRRLSAFVDAEGESSQHCI